MVAIKCDHCIERQKLGQIPACAEVCKVGALEFGEINELVKAARAHYSERILQSLGQEGIAPAPQPFVIEIWQGWGAAVSVLNAKET